MLKVTRTTPFGAQKMFCKNLHFNSLAHVQFKFLFLGIGILGFFHPRKITMCDFSVYFQESGFYQLHCFLQWWKQLSKSNFTSDITFSSFAAMELENSHHLMH